MGYEAAGLEQREVGDLILIPGHKDKIKIVGVSSDRHQDDGTIFLPLGLVQKMFKKEGLLTRCGGTHQEGAGSKELEDRLYNLPDVQAVSMAAGGRCTIRSLVGTAVRDGLFHCGHRHPHRHVGGHESTIITSRFKLKGLKSSGFLKAWAPCPVLCSSSSCWKTLFLCFAGGLLGIGMAFAREKAYDSWPFETSCPTPQRVP